MSHTSGGFSGGSGGHSSGGFSGGGHSGGSSGGHGGFGGGSFGHDPGDFDGPGWSGGSGGSGSGGGNRGSGLVFLILFTVLVISSLFDGAARILQTAAMAGIPIYALLLNTGVIARIQKKIQARKRRNHGAFFPVLPTTDRGTQDLIREFSERWQLYLTEEQIKKIATASFYDETWENELYAMTKDYLSAGDWIYGHPIPDENARPQYAPAEGSNAGRTAWLRAYLAAFMVQEIYYDWNIQKQAVRNAFEEIFAFAARYEHLPTEERCDLINREFYTRFDPVSLGAAKQFLEEEKF